MLNSIGFFFFFNACYKIEATLFSGFTSCLCWVTGSDVILSWNHRYQVMVYGKLGKVSFYLTFQRLKSLETLLEYQLGFFFYSRIAPKVVLAYVKPYFGLLNRTVALQLLKHSHMSQTTFDHTDNKQ